MSEKKEKKYYNEKTWSLDCKLAQKQQLCWLLCAVCAIGGSLLILYLMPGETATYGLIILAILLMIGYQWLAKAPVRALYGWMGKRKQGTADVKAALAYVEKLEKSLPGMKRRELAVTLVNIKAIFFFDNGRQHEAIALLQNFKNTWDESQRQVIEENIQRMQKKMGLSSQEKEETPCEQ